MAAALPLALALLPLPRRLASPVPPPRPRPLQKAGPHQGSALITVMVAVMLLLLLSAQRAVAPHTLPHTLSAGGAAHRFRSVPAAAAHTWRVAPRCLWLPRVRKGSGEAAVQPVCAEKAAACCRKSLCRVAIVRRQCVGGYM